MNAGAFPQKPVLFLAGAAHLDRRGRCDAAFRAGASNPGRMVEAVGGAAFNAARAMRLLGASVRLASARGGDAAGRVVEEALGDLGIEDLALTWLDRPTPTYTALLDATGDLVGGLADMALYDLMRPRVFARRHLREALASCDGVMVDANLPSATIEHLVEAAGQRHATAIGVSPAKVGRLAPVLARLSALFLSEAEAARLTGVEGQPIATVAERLIDAGVRRAVVTDGPRPAAIIERGIVRWQAPPPVARHHDVTGAGDTLAGVATSALSAGGGFLSAARLGMAAASLHISADRGARSVAPDDIEDLAASMPPPRDTRLQKPTETP